MTVPISSTALYNAYVDWREDADSGEADQFPCSAYGLCDALRYPDKTTRDKCELELATQFYEAGLDNCYPFGYTEYWDHFHEGRMHLDPSRRAWVDARIADYEELVP